MLITNWNSSSFLCFCTMGLFIAFWRIGKTNTFAETKIQIKGLSASLLHGAESAKVQPKYSLWSPSVQSPPTAFIFKHRCAHSCPRLLCLVLVLSSQSTACQGLWSLEYKDVGWNPGTIEINGNFATYFIGARIYFHPWLPVGQRWVSPAREAETSEFLNKEACGLLVL